MKNKGGQVTIFIIVAIIIVAGVSAYFLIRDKESLSEETEFLEAEEVYVFVQECLEEVSEEVIETIGQGGGYYFPPEKSNDFGITYYLMEGKSHVPSKLEIESEISNYVSQKLVFCTKSFIDFSEYEIEQEEVEAKTKIMSDVVLIEVDYPIFVSKGNLSLEFREFESIVFVNLGEIYSFIEDISEKEIKNKGACLSCYLDKTGEDFGVEMFDYDESVVFIWEDKNSKINGENFEWIYTNSYGGLN